MSVININEKDRVKMAQAIQTMKDQLPMILESIEIHAQLTRAKFDGLVKQGFTPEQALELSKTL